MQRADEKLNHRLLRFARSRGGADWLSRAITAYLGDSEREFDDVEMQIAIPWALYHFPSTADGTSIAQLFQAEHGERLPSDLREVLDAQLAAWLSVWDVREVQLEVGMALTDLLTGEERFVYEVSGSRTVAARDVLLGRVVDCKGMAFLAGLSPRVLPPRAADAVIRDIRHACGVGTKAVKVEKVMDHAIQQRLLESWQLAVEELDRPKPLPTLTNTDGDEFLLTTDHFEFAEQQRSAVTQRLATLPGAGEGVDQAGETEFVVTQRGNAQFKSWDNTIVGRLVLKGTRLEAESNSARRADALRRQIETHLGNLVRHRLRDESTAQALLAAARTTPRSGRVKQQEIVPAEIQAIQREFRTAHMLAWLDENIPALGGLTPREAAALPRRRAELDLLLREFEHNEARRPAAERIDIARLRSMLGMAE
ncbi:MAG: hypothetical protein ACREOG_18265 [Gemmatimonadaceae bacterium]